MSRERVALLVDPERIEAMICHQSPTEHDCHVLGCYIDAEEMREYLREREPGRGSSTPTAPGATQ